MTSPNSQGTPGPKEAVSADVAYAKAEELILSRPPSQAIVDHVMKFAEQNIPPKDTASKFLPAVQFALSSVLMSKEHIPIPSPESESKARAAKAFGELKALIEEAQSTRLSRSVLWTAIDKFRNEHGKHIVQKDNKGHVAFKGKQETQVYSAKDNRWVIILDWNSETGEYSINYMG